MQIHYRKLKNTEKQRTTVTLIPLHNFTHLYNTAVTALAYIVPGPFFCITSV